MSHTFRTSEKTAFICNSDYSGPIEIFSTLEGHNDPQPHITNVDIEDIETFLEIKLESEIISLLESTQFNIEQLSLLKNFIKNL